MTDNCLGEYKITLWSTKNEGHLNILRGDPSLGIWCSEQYIQHNNSM
jgi:hypothetical protein